MADYEPDQQNAPGFSWDILETVTIWRGMADEIEDAGLEAWGRPSGRSLPGFDHSGDWDYGILASIMGGLNVQTQDSCRGRDSNGNYTEDFKEAVERIVSQYRMAGASSLLFVQVTTSSSADNSNAIAPEKAFGCAMVGWAYPEVEAVTLWPAIGDQESIDRAEEFLQLRDQALDNQTNLPAPQPVPKPQSAPGSIFTVPGRIEAEDYKTGGEGVGYHDNDAGNVGGEYRSDDVDIQSTSDNGGGYEVMRIAGGEWLAFDVEVTQGGTYNVTARVASGSDRTKSFHVEIGGQDVTGDMSFDDSQGYDSFVDVTVEGVSLTAGRHELRLVMHTGYFSFNHLDLVLSEPVKESPLLVGAGSDLTITLPEYATLGGTFNYDGLPNPPGAFSIQWSQVRGPGSASFADAAAVDTIATFSHPGDYVLKLTVDDGNLSSSDQVTVTVTSALDPTVAPTPVPDAPPDEEPLEGPEGVAFYDGSPFTYVTNPRTDTVQVFNSGGALVNQWGGPGSGEGQFNNPSGIVINHDNGFVYIADTGNHRVQMFDTAGGFITQWGGPGEGEGQFNSPSGIAINPDSGFVYVADTGNNRVQAFNANGGFITQWGSSGRGNGELREPTGIAFNPLDGKVYVADTGNNRIQVFLSVGAYDSRWGRKGSERGRLLSPGGILVHPVSGSLYVADSGNHRIQVFDRLGNVLFAWGVEGGTPSEFRNPVGLSADPGSGRIYIADSGNQRIQVFSQGGTFAFGWSP
jgi:DNA-binding beta-propeller fold protein YncE